MKAIILAAGEGQRLRPLTNDRPKCLVEYRGRPILEYALEALRSSGISDIVVVGGYRHEMLDRYGLKKIINPQYADTNMVHTLFSAEAELNEDIIISYADIIYNSKVLSPLVASTNPISVVVDRKWRELWEARMENPLVDAETMKLSPEGLILELGKKPRSLEDIQGQYIGLIKIRRDAWGDVLKLYHSLDPSELFDSKPLQKMYMTSFIQLIIDQLSPVHAVFIDGGWLEIDCVSDLGCSPL